MPGVVPSTHLKGVIGDSLILGPKVRYNLIQRGVNRLDDALNLRIAESALFRETHPEVWDAAIFYYRTAGKDPSLDGNSYVYSAASTITTAIFTTESYKSLVKKEVEDLLVIAEGILDIKGPPEMNKLFRNRLPSGYQKIRAQYSALRYLITAMKSALSATGAQRGRFIELSRSALNAESLYEKIKKEVSKRQEAFPEYLPYVSEVVAVSGLAMTLYRVSDFIALRVSSRERTHIALLTSLHLERLEDLLRETSNVLLGVTLSYGLNDEIQSETAIDTVKYYIRMLLKEGVKNSKTVGENSKAGSDILKARISQTTELPYNNRHLLMKSYSEERAEKGAMFEDILHQSGLDLDIKVNLSFMWKMSLQTDSDMKADFDDLAQALKEPNKVSTDAPNQIECAMRRSILVGALREGRQPKVTTTTAQRVPEEIVSAISTPTPSDADLRAITAGSVMGVKVTVPSVFPDATDTSYLRFKDKSSALEDENLSAKVDAAGSEVSKLQELEDEEILRSSEEAASVFLDRIRSLKGPESIKKALKATSNDILAAFDDTVQNVFLSAERKYHAICESLLSIDKDYGEEGYLNELLQWAENHPHLLINTVTEPKLGEVHKKVARIFYMFERGMKMFLSQFERIARVADHYIKGAEIVRGESSREKHMNILSSAHMSGIKSSTLGYSILFDLSKFSQKFNHKLIDAAAKVIGEAVDYPGYSNLSSVFKASMLILCSRGLASTSASVLGAFEGFLNFLWTGVHALVMDVALKNCGRTGDLAAYSDDGLLMFTLTSTTNSELKDIQHELISVMDSIKSTYESFGLDFHLGKTILSRVFSEFLGVMMYRGKRIPVWIKELVKLGKREELKALNPISQSIKDITSQGSALIKASMSPYIAWLLTYYEVMLGPGRRLRTLALEQLAKVKVPRKISLVPMVINLYFVLSEAWGGVRTPDIVSSMTTSDKSPLSEMVYEISELTKRSDTYSGIWGLISESIRPTADYKSLFTTGVVVSTRNVNYGMGAFSARVSKELVNIIGEEKPHPLARRACPELHESLEALENLDITWVSMVGACSVAAIEYDRETALTRSSAIRKLLTRDKIRSLQVYDTVKTSSVIREYVLALLSPSSTKPLTADEILSRSFPNLSISAQLPAYRQLAWLSADMTPYCEISQVSPNRDLITHSGSDRLANMTYYDELAPALVTADIRSSHIGNVSDLVGHCTRTLYSIAVSASSHGNDIALLVDEMCIYNRSPTLPVTLMTSLIDLRKVAVSNKKKALHRVYGAMPVKSQIRMSRSGLLNHKVCQTPDMHHSLIVTLALAFVTLKESLIRQKYEERMHYVGFRATELDKIKLPKTKPKPEGVMGHRGNRPMRSRMRIEGMSKPQYESLVNEADRSARALSGEIQERLLAGRMAMMVDTKYLTGRPDAFQPLRSATIWSIVSKLKASLSGETHRTGVSTFMAEMDGISTIPGPIVDSAIYHVVVSSCNKKKIKDYILGRTDETPVSERYAMSCMVAARELGLQPTISLDMLLTRDACKIYSAQMSAEKAGLVLFSLDRSYEDGSTRMISRSRARAIRAGIEHQIDKMFDEKTEDTEADSDRLMMMVLSDCVRGSIHRTQPYNSGVALSWIRVFINAVVDMAQRLENMPRMGPRDSSPRRQEENSIVDASFDRAYRREKPKWGQLGDFVRATKYIKKLVEWGAIRDLAWFYGTGVPNKTKVDKGARPAPRHPAKRANPPMANPAAYQTYLYETFVKPIINMTKTISYSAVDEVIRNYQGSITVSDVYLLEEYVDDLKSKHPWAPTRLHLLALPACETYRALPGKFKDIHLEASSPHGGFEVTGYLLAYSLALPLIMSTGTSGISNVVCIGNYNQGRLSEHLLSVIREHSLPEVSSTKRKDLILLLRSSEFEIRDFLLSYRRTAARDAICVIELPPDNTAWTLGLITYVSTTRNVYLTNALSSDMRGTSLYLVSDGFPDPPTGLPACPRTYLREIVNLSEMSLSSVDLGNREVCAALLPGLVISPMLQAGLSASFNLEEDGLVFAIHTEEELMDRRRVSFLSSHRSNEFSIKLAALPLRLGALCVRLTNVIRSDMRPLNRLLIAGAYMSDLLTGDLTSEQYLRIYEEAYQALDSDGRELLLRMLKDMVLDAPKIDVSAMPLAAQLEESSLPMLELSALRVMKKDLRRAETIDATAERVRDYAERGNPITSEFKKQAEPLTVQKLIHLVQTELEDEDDDEEVVVTATMSLRPEDRFRQTHQSLEFRPQSSSQLTDTHRHNSSLGLNFIDTMPSAPPKINLPPSWADYDSGSDEEWKAATNVARHKAATRAEPVLVEIPMIEVGESSGGKASWDSIEEFRGIPEPPEKDEDAYVISAETARAIIECRSVEILRASDQEARVLASAAGAWAAEVSNFEDYELTLWGRRVLDKLHDKVKAAGVWGVV